MVFLQVMSEQKKRRNQAIIIVPPWLGVVSKFACFFCFYSTKRLARVKVKVLWMA